MLESVPKLEDFIYALKDEARQEIIEDVIYEFKKEIIAKLDTFEKGCIIFINKNIMNHVLNEKQKLFLQV